MRNAGIMEQMDYETFVDIIANIPSCIFFKDTDLRYRFSSHYWAQLETDDIEGKTDLDIRKDKENAMKAMEADRAIIESKKGCRYVIESDIDGEVSYLELIKEPIIKSDGTVIGIVGLINDVTEKTIMEKKIVGMSEMLEVQCRELEGSNEELKATLAKVEQMHASQKMFTASMNHELRSPLNGIIGNLQLLMDDESLNIEQQKNVRNAFISSQLMLEIVNELLDFAKMEMSGFNIKHEPFILSKLTDNIDYIARTQATPKGLEFTLEKEKDMPDSFIGDSTRITQIMHNFVSNAIKYTDTGKVKLKVSYVNGRLIIACSDTGQGIAKESMDTLFDPFVRFNEERNVNIQGTGLGLSVVKKLIDSMNGEIKVISKVNVGSTFTVKIPMEIAPDAVDENKSTLTDNEGIDFGKYKALCIDDSKISLMFMESILKKIGMEADVACCASEGISKAENEKYDIIFMDHMMPEMDGIEAFDIIKKGDSINSDTPIVMLTGNAEASCVELYKSKGIEGYLVKPVMKEHIISTVSSMLK